nr:hypothetical protein [Lacticaseibacillus sharpeae]
MQLAERIINSKDAGLGNLLAAPKQNQVSFAGGLPDPDLFPQRELNAGFNRALASTTAALQYSSAAGYQPLRKQLAARLVADGVPASTESVLITQGAQQALDLIGRLVLDPGARVIVEGPTYPGALAALGTYERVLHHPRPRRRHGHGAGRCHPRTRRGTADLHRPRFSKPHRHRHESG